ncbi:TorF family putative porin [Phenylobacterium sp.]|uniref:TorF family putative porin n=1 Tax=Phenylobacterium sp. TaxID=1871053 RepID=UPI002734CE35|nr:TorF family putative porin [Phenylobacterium sp.]MDP3854017.1 TorF family putative porin [Phenylobacterium sp.]
MKLIKTTLLAAVASVAMSGAALAQEGVFDFSYNVGVATDYVFRGVSQTDENGQLFAGVDTTLWGIGYAGAWISNVDFGGSTDGELDLYAGVKPKVGPVQLDIGVIYYGYLNQSSGADEDYTEFKIAGSVPAGPATVGAAFYYSDDFFGGTGEATYFEVNGSVPVAEKVTLSGAIGQQNVVGPFDYTTWNLGAGYAINDTVGLDLRYHDTDEDSFGEIYEGRVVLGLKVVF